MCLVGMAVVVVVVSSIVVLFVHTHHTTIHCHQKQRLFRFLPFHEDRETNIVSIIFLVNILHVQASCRVLSQCGHMDEALGGHHHSVLVPDAHRW